ncbi:MAG TPA: hypothetical protein VN696_12205 [Pyrinomonadaceae bacterium]|nr:hypothetical protein [Pyrinomonadaceae bacterium]
MSEELENSLLKAIETHLDDRFRAISEDLARLQSEFNDTFGRLRESATTGQLESTPLGSAISAHLQAAREQKLSGATPAPPAPPDLSLLKSAIEDIRNQRTQSDVLNALIRNAAQFADRAVLFVVKGDQAIAWHKAEATNRNDLQPVSGVALPLAGSSVVSESARTAATETSSGTRADDGSLIEQLGGKAQQLATVPLVVRRKVVAVLYADSAWPHRDAIQLDALEVLTQVAAIAVELVSSARAAHPQPQVSAPEPATQPRAVESAPAVAETVEPQVEEATYTPQVEPAAVEGAPAHVEVEAEPAEAVAAAPEVEAEVTPESQPEPVAEPSADSTPTMEAEPVATAPVAAPTAVEEPRVAAPAPIEQPAQPVFSAQYSTPLGSTRRWGNRDAELPVEVSDDEKPLHNDARRFARLLVSEIKLYNEQKVSEGRNQGDIYERLREDIDRSRQMYDKRVAPPVAARHDYFHHELVNTLAEGDEAKLGHSYPGAAVGVA